MSNFNLIYFKFIFLIIPVLISPQSTNTSISVKPNLGIIGGQDTNDKFCTHSVSISIKCGSLQGLCSGTLISPTKVLTAGHCVFGFESFTVCTGDNKCGEEATECITTTKGFVHPKYFITMIKERLIKYDAAVLFLPKPFSIASQSVLKLAPKGRDVSFYFGQTAYGCGCGLTNENTEELPIIVQNGCSTVRTHQQVEAEGFGEYANDKTIIFAIGSENNVADGEGGTCNGDSGSALFVFENNTSEGCIGPRPDITQLRYAIGIVSFGVEKCPPNTSDAYTYIGAAENRDFIDNPQENGCTHPGCLKKADLVGITQLHVNNLMADLTKKVFLPQVVRCKTEQILSSVASILVDENFIPPIPILKLLPSP